MERKIASGGRIFMALQINGLPKQSPQFKLLEQHFDFIDMLNGQSKVGVTVIGGLC